MPPTPSALIALGNERLKGILGFGQKAIVLCVPITTGGVRRNGDNVGRNPNDEEDGGEEHQGEVSSRTFFAYRPRCFVLAQTDGEPYANPSSVSCARRTVPHPSPPRI